VTERGQCDFCSQPDPVWVYPTQDFDMTAAPAPFNVGWGSRGAWAACEPCSALIEQDAWDALAKRSVVENPRTAAEIHNRAERRIAIQAAALLHRQFRRLRKPVPRMGFG
jgi:hypothetical protein